MEKQTFAAGDKVKFATHIWQTTTGAARERGRLARGSVTFVDAERDLYTVAWEHLGNREVLAERGCDLALVGQAPECSPFQYGRLVTWSDAALELHPGCEGYTGTVREYDVDTGQVRVLWKQYGAIWHEPSELSLVKVPLDVGDRVRYSDHALQRISDVTRLMVTKAYRGTVIEWREHGKGVIVRWDRYGDQIIHPIDDLALTDGNQQ